MPASIQSPEFDVKRFGAKGDGTTNDTTSINNCFTAAAAYATTYGTAVVRIPRGNYVVTKVTLSGSNITVYAGGARWLMSTSGVGSLDGDAMLKITGSYNKVYDLELDGNSANSPAGANRLLKINGDGSDSGSAAGSDNLISGVYAHDSRNAGLGSEDCFQITNGNRNVLFKCTARNSGFNGFRVSGNDNKFLQCTTIDHKGRGIRVDNGDSLTIDGCLVSSSHPDTEAGLMCDPGSGKWNPLNPSKKPQRIKRLIVRNSKFFNNAINQGTIAAKVASADYALFDGCEIRSGAATNNDGLNVEDCVDVIEVVNCQIHPNVLFRDAGSAGTSVYDGAVSSIASVTGSTNEDGVYSYTNKTRLTLSGTHDIWIGKKIYIHGSDVAALNGSHLVIKQVSSTQVDIDLDWPGSSSIGSNCWARTGNCDVFRMRNCTVGSYRVDWGGTVTNIRTDSAGTPKCRIRPSFDTLMNTSDSFTVSGSSVSAYNVRHTISAKPTATGTVSAIISNGAGTPKCRVTTSAATNIAPGDPITISGSSVGGYNTTHTVSAVNSNTEFDTNIGYTADQVGTSTWTGTFNLLDTDIGYTSDPTGTMTWFKSGGAVSSIADNGSGKCRITTALSHYARPEDTILVAGSSVSGYNVGHTITNIISTTSFDTNVTYSSSPTGTMTWRNKEQNLQCFEDPCCRVLDIEDVKTLQAVLDSTQVRAIDWNVTDDKGFDLIRLVRCDATFATTNVGQLFRPLANGDVATTRKTVSYGHRVNNLHSGGTATVGNTTSSIANRQILLSTDGENPYRYRWNDKPSSGDTGTSFSVGDVVMNSAYTRGSPLGWVCFVAGAPGTWQPFGGEFTHVANVTEVGNVGTGEDDLLSYTLPANSLSASGASMQIDAGFTFANNANAKQVKMYLGGQLLYASGSSAHADGGMHVRITVLRDTVNTAKVTLTATSSGGGTPFAIAFGDSFAQGSVDFSTGLIIKGTGEATSNNDIVMEHLLVRTYLAP